MLFSRILIRLPWLPKRLYLRGFVNETCVFLLFVKHNLSYFFISTITSAKIEKNGEKWHACMYVCVIPRFIHTSGKGEECSAYFSQLWLTNEIVKVWWKEVAKLFLLRRKLRALALTIKQKTTFVAMKGKNSNNRRKSIRECRILLKSKQVVLSSNSAGRQQIR